MRSLRVLRVLASLEAAVGGPAESAVNACIAAQRAGIDNTLVVLLPERSLAGTANVRERLDKEGVRLLAFAPVPRESYHALRWAISPLAAAWLGRFGGQYDLLHVHGAWGLSQLAGLLAAETRNRPCVMSPHEALTMFDIAEGGANKLRPAAKKALKWTYLRRLSLIVFSSSLEAQDSVPQVSTARTTIIPHPLRDAFEIPINEGRQPGDPLRIGFLGRLHEKKNLDLLIRAIQVGTRTAQLLIAGDGPEDYKRGLERLSQETGMEDRLEWLGFVEGERKWKFLDHVDLLAMPSQYECFGMAAAEALARGTPPVVSERTGIADLIKRSGAGLVAPATVDSFAEVLGALESNHARLAELAAAGPPSAQAELSLAAYGSAIRQEYEALLGGR